MEEFHPHPTHLDEQKLRCSPSYTFISAPPVRSNVVHSQRAVTLLYSSNQERRFRSEGLALAPLAGRLEGGCGPFRGPGGLP